MMSLAPAYAPLKVSRAVRFILYYYSFTDRTADVALVAVGLYASMLTGRFYVHVFFPMIIGYSSTGMMMVGCPLVRPSSKWSEFTPTKITVISSSKFFCLLTWCHQLYG